MPLHALVADDDPAVRSLTAKLLAACEFDVTTAADGVEAADILLDADRPPLAVAVIDCDMPLLDGPGVLTRVRAAGGRLPILLVSGTHSPLAIPAGDPLTAFLAKPFSLGLLRAAVEALLAADEPMRVAFGGARMRDGEEAFPSPARRVPASTSSSVFAGTRPETARGLHRKDDAEPTS